MLYRRSLFIYFIYSQTILFKKQVINAGNTEELGIIVHLFEYIVQKWFIIMLLFSAPHTASENLKLTGTYHAVKEIKMKEVLFRVQ